MYWISYAKDLMKNVFDKLSGENISLCIHLEQQTPLHIPNRSKKYDKLEIIQVPIYLGQTKSFTFWNLLNLGKALRKRISVFLKRKSCSY